ncbi:MAG: hypothetical protein DSZ07_03945 [Sulfurovum sp.]|nr:MAG: hypothetical protein DSZ07_03945 [Sulfurovum sp.]
MIIIINILNGDVMKKKIIGLALFTIVGVEANNVNQTIVDGYIRGTYQSHDVKDDKVYKDDAIGGKLHFETASTDGVSLGASFYGTSSVVNDDNHGLISLRGESHKSYGILGEAYLKSKFGKNVLTIGRQEIETPFAQVDDIGMIPNTFEAVTLINNEMKDTTLFLGQIQKMAGVDAEVTDKFTKVNGSKNMQVLGLNYEGIDNLALLGWYYRLSGAEVDKITYLEATYEKEFGAYGYGWGLQYSKQGHNVGKSTQILGATLSVSAINMGLTFSTAYNETKDGSAFSGFGGGPFFSNSEYLILDNAGDDAKAKWMGVELDASVLGMDGLNIGIGKITLETEENKKATEVDFVASYEINKDIEMHMIYSDLKGANVDEDDAKHLRIYANYNF